MGKKDKKPAPAADTAADIDDIFAAPKKSKPSADAKPSKSKSSSKADKSGASEKSEKSEKKSEKKDKKEKSEKSEKKRKSVDSEEPAKKKKSKETSERVVEEVVDPSLAVKAAVEKAKQKPVKTKAAKGKEVEEDMAFRDSRGDAGREYHPPHPHTITPPSAITPAATSSQRISDWQVEDGVQICGATIAQS